MRKFSPTGMQSRQQIAWSKNKRSKSNWSKLMLYQRSVFVLNIAWFSNFCTETMKQMMNKSFKDCVTSSLFILNVIYFGVLCLRLNYFMSSYVSWITDLCFRILPDCLSGRFSVRVGLVIKNLSENRQKAQSQVSKYVNIMGIIQLLEAVTYAPLVGVMADYLEVFFSRWSHNLHPRVASLRANSVCLAVCSLFGFISAVAPCIGKK